MRKFPVTSGIFIGLCMAYVAVFGTALRDTITGLIEQSNLCTQRDTLCVAGDASILFVAVVVITFIIEVLLSRRDDWDGVRFTCWAPTIDHEILGGIRIQNESGTDLDECMAALIGYRAAPSNPSIRATAESPGSTHKDSLLPSTLFWSINRALQTEARIGRGKEGFLAIGFPVQKSEAHTTGREFVYKIKTAAVDLLHPVSRGYIDIRISAKVNSKSIAPARKSVRIEVTDKTLFFREVVDTRLPKKNPKRPLGGIKPQPGIRE